MKEKKDQFVIACLEKAADADVVMPYARYYAERLGKGIIVLNVSKDGDNEWIKQYNLPYIGLKGDWKTAIDGLPTAFGGVLAVTAVDLQAPRISITNPTTLLKTFADCKIAYLVIRNEKLEIRNSAGASTIPHSSFLISNCYLTLDYRRESKEKLIWGSYMVRFFGAKLTVATPDYSDAGLREKVNNNILFLKKIYKSLDIDYTIKPITLPRFTSPDMALIESTSRQVDESAGNSSFLIPHSSLLIAMTTDKRDRDLGDLIAGPTERRLLQRSTIPILFLNQRDDLYVLCD